ncbi:DUF2946 domain-containing protein [Simplicispira hankyongi]|uniref:DUF2946 domain-containing protein n=1 Tax=Simplicispira hankyongi TaxID=2315688 RepID=UPI0011C46B4D|nr:DUF2946 domain-containing protein [Simplicispira hankyongi]
MKTLRALTWLRQVLLASFFCALGAATAAPLIHPTRTQLVCTGTGGVTLLVLGDDGLPVTAASLHCPLCLPAAGPAPASIASLPTPTLVSEQPAAPRPRSAITQSAAPPPGRGPPFFTEATLKES